MLLTTTLSFLAGLGTAAARDLSARATGDRQCGTSMCITAIVNSTTVEYQLTSRNVRTPGWMGMGFGDRMINSPMVIMWANSDGTITLSQREATQYATPSVVSSPDRLATLQERLSSTSDTDTTFTFTVDANEDTTQSVIYAFGITNPGSSNEAASIQQHLDSGTFSLDLTGTISATVTASGTSAPTGTSTSGSGTSGSGSSGSGSSSGSDTGPTSDIPLQPYQRLIVAHAIFCSIGFLLFLPFGSLLARYLRTFSPVWYTGHWISQFALAGTMIVIGFALGVQSVTSAKALHLDDDHKRWGVAIFVLYLVQCGVGALIHYVKPKHASRRPPQNYFHAVFGLLVISLAFYQVRSGYKTEWPSTTGRGDAPHAVDVVWYIWVVLMPVLYLCGLAFLPKQYRQEAEMRKGGWAARRQYAGDNDHIDMADVRLHDRD